jgi:hypothetical protein
MTRPHSYLLGRGFFEAVIAEVGWRIEPIGARTDAYGLPHQAAEALAWFIPYRNPNSKIVFERLRLIDDADLARFGGGKYRQPARRSLALYDPFGALAGDAPLDALLLIEGEANAVAAHLMVPELPVVGLPGQGALHDRLAEQLGHVLAVYVWLDRDAGFARNGASIDARLRKAGVEEVLFVGDSEGDANETLVTHGPSAAGQMLNRMLEAATPLLQGGAVNAASLLEEVIDFLRRFVVLRSEAQAVAIALWVLHTHALDAASDTPYLLIASPEKRCGKSRLLDALEVLVAKPWPAIMPSEAVVFRKIDTDRPTLLLDEVDAIFKSATERTEPLRALLNAGNRPGSTVPRCVGPNSQVRDFSTFCAKALAGIDNGRLPDTISDRSIQIRLERKARDERTERFRQRRVKPEADPLRERISRWAEAHVETLVEADADVPEEINDRAADGWEPLLAIADMAGGAWPDRARRAALELSANVEPEDDSTGVRLLADLRSTFDESNANRISTADLLAALATMDEAPWASWASSRRRHPGLTASDLAKLLKPYRVRSKSIWLPGGTSAKGYMREQFEEAWARYLPGYASPAVRASDSASGAASSAIAQRQEPLGLTAVETCATPHGEPILTGLTAESGEQTLAPHGGPADSLGGSTDVDPLLDLPTDEQKLLAPLAHEFDGSWEDAD